MSRAQRISIVTAAICLAAMAGVAWVLWLFWPSLIVLSQGNRIEHVYYIPAESMLPTLEVNDRIMPLGIGKDGPKRGDIIVFEASDSTRVSRVAAVAGDMIEMRAGIVFLNGRAAPQRALGAGPTSAEGEITRLVAERFPGESHEHRILDMGYSPADTVAATPVTAGTVYVLGDNRDRTADSRVPIADGGVGQVPLGKILGLVDMVYWSKDRSRIAVPINNLPVRERTTR